MIPVLNESARAANAHLTSQYTGTWKSLVKRGLAALENPNAESWRYAHLKHLKSGDFAGWQRGYGGMNAYVGDVGNEGRTLAERIAKLSRLKALQGNDWSEAVASPFERSEDFTADEAVSFALMTSAREYRLSSTGTNHVVYGGEVGGSSILRMVVAAGTRCQLIEYVLGAENAFTSIFNSIEVCEGATLEHLRVYVAAAGTVHAPLNVEVLPEGRFYFWEIGANSEMVRSSMRVNLNENAHGILRGFTSVYGQQQFDQVLVVSHDAPGGISDQRFHSVVHDKALNVFNGKIIVQKHASKTVASQNHRAMLVSPDGFSVARPQLEIYNDDVKCSHGSTCGELDPAKLFYLRSRGIDEKTAKQMLIEAFAFEVSMDLPEFGQSVWKLALKVQGAK